jgi:hypothetical protein
MINNEQSHSEGCWEAKYNHPNKMSSEELKKEWEDKLITTLPGCDIKVIDDYYSLKLAKQQEEIVKIIDGLKTKPELYKDDENKRIFNHLTIYNQCIADIKSKLNK